MKLFIFRCIYMQRDTAYELQVEIVKDYAEVKNDILDVLNVIERNDNYQETVKKVRELNLHYMANEKRQFLNNFLFSVY